MTLGTGIFASTVLILLAGSIFLVSTKQKWRLVGKIVGVVVLIGAVIGVGIWGWGEYENRLVVATELGGIRLGMSPVDVTLLKGEPTFASDNTDDETAVEYASRYLYFAKKFDDGNGVLSIMFAGQNKAAVIVSRICHSSEHLELLGVTTNLGENAVIKRLGEPTHVSINENGLSKYISYNQWKVAYQIVEGEVIQLCITESGKVTHKTEYGEESELGTVSDAGLGQDDPVVNPADSTD